MSRVIRVAAIGLSGLALTAAALHFAPGADCYGFEPQAARGVVDHVIPAVDGDLALGCLVFAFLGLLVVWRPRAKLGLVWVVAAGYNYVAYLANQLWESQGDYRVFHARWGDTASTTVGWVLFVGASVFFLSCAFASIHGLGVRLLRAARGSEQLVARV